MSRGGALARERKHAGLSLKRDRRVCTALAVEEDVSLSSSLATGGGALAPPGVRVGNMCELISLVSGIPPGYDASTYRKDWRIPMGVVLTTKVMNVLAEAAREKVRIQGITMSSYLARLIEADLSIIPRGIPPPVPKKVNKPTGT